MLFKLLIFTSLHQYRQLSFDSDTAVYHKLADFMDLTAIIIPKYSVHNSYKSTKSLRNV